MPPETTKPRPGQFIKTYLEGGGSGSISEIHQAYKAKIDNLNAGRARGEKLRKPTYASWYRYFRNLRVLGLLELIGEQPTEDIASPEEMGFAEKVAGKWKVHRGAIQRIFRMTALGQAEVAAWNDPMGALGYTRRTTPTR